MARAIRMPALCGTLAGLMGVLVAAAAAPRRVPRVDRSNGVAAQKPPLPRSDCFFGLHFDIHAKSGDRNLGRDVTAANVARLLDSVHPDFVQWDLKGSYGFASYPTRIGYPAPGIVKDALPIWRAATSQRRIALYGYYSGLVDQQAAAHHGDWARRDAAGRSDGMTLSTFSPYTTALMIPQMNEAMARYGLDGLWVDTQAPAAGLDYSAAARAAWKNATGQANPPTKASDPQWLAWRQFNRAQFLAHAATWVNAVHAARPGAQVASNWTFSANAPVPISARVDFLTGDFSSGNGLDLPRFQARYLSSVGLPWDLMGWGFVHTSSGRDQSLAAQFMEQEAAAVIMHGGAFQIYHHPGPGGAVTGDIIRQAAQVAAFMRQRQAVSFKSVSVPQVALLASEQTYLDRCQTAFALRGEWDEAQGVLHALLEAHYSVDVLGEASLLPRLQQFPLIVVPNSYRLTPNFLAAISDYVRGGGKILVVGARCMPLFQSMLGVTLNGPPAILPAYVPTRIGLASATGYWQAVTLAPGTREISRRYSTTDFHAPVSEPAGSLAALGAGEAAALYGPAAMDYSVREGDRVLRQWILDAVAQVFPNPAVRLDGPDTVDLSLRRTHDGRLCVHLLNRTPISPSALSNAAVAPAGPMTLWISARAKPGRVIWLPGNQPLRWTWENGGVSVRVSNLRIHGVVVME